MGSVIIVDFLKSEHSMRLSTLEIAKKINGEVLGSPELLISCLSSLDNVAPNSLVFCDGEANFNRALASEAAVILTNKPAKVSTQKTQIIVSHPFKAFITLIALFNPPILPKPGIHPSSVIAENVTIGKDVYIGPFVSIAENSIIGDNCTIHSHVAIGAQVTLGASVTLHPHVVLYPHTKLGQEVIIHAGSIIGCDGFGYLSADNELIKVPHVGAVCIEEQVEIGANTTVDRATLGETKIGLGTKIDNLVQIAHSVKLGQHNIVCAFTGIAGSTQSGNHVTFAANVGVSDHVLIDDNVILSARAGVPPKKHLLKGNVYLGSPARPWAKGIEHELSVTRIPIMRKKLQALTEKVNSLWKLVNKDEII